ncbi:hypothetical protein [Candidatus Methanodesulfokora washburnensis]|uniref:Type IV pilin n=1 Tax=Candidatus Methanodesulfokora washburnensis TaxID=2478471 RepID=A0A3R9QSR4_9CREN|nr:hypothetical protein [Candidatus Methanodesulfokores washburnensis]RSN72262.1 hypothetical protein D6D85_14600 [Candidatus Methanodesulfokores washburnensis]
MRAGISRVVVEIIILVIAVALALLIFSPISGYIFGSLGRTSTVGGASQIQVLNAQYSGNTLTLYVKNLGPGTMTVSGVTNRDFRVYVDGNACNNCNATTATWTAGMTITVNCTTSFDTTKQHSIVVYGPGNTQAQYLYYPPPS